jgi:S-adenosylmethionine:tRNA ribosyltransferase-isomerase
MLRLSAYRYDLPPAQIAQAPADRRDASRLLHVATEGLVGYRFRELAQLLPEGAVVVVNDTRVIPARLRAAKPTGGAVELLALEPAGQGEGGERWRCLARSSKPIRPGLELLVTGLGGAEGGPVRVVEVLGGGAIIVEFPGAAAELFERFGESPLPPYIERRAGGDPVDRERYQTIFAREPGAVAAPTAGLHFTPELCADLEARGVTVAPLTLHVGLGTFAPVRVEHLEDHELHAERYLVPEATAELVSSGRPVVAVGTTVVRALESAAEADRRVAAGAGQTRLFIRPGHRFRAVDHLVTNFHLPESTLLVLVCAFAGHERTMAAYRHAVAEGFRFFSYGDAMLVSRAEGDG